MAPSGVDGGDRQLRPAAGVGLARRRIEHGDLDAFLAQLEPAAGVAHLELGVELGKVVEAGAGQV
jgi:hypothetical protein